MKQIKFKYIVKIQSALMTIFEEEDVDFEFVNRKKVNANNRAIQHYLDKITDDKEEQREILKIIEEENFNTLDFTFKPICEKLKDKGYEIIYKKAQ